MRAFFTLLHRWIGLATATFLLIAGATGAVISWTQELDGVLNPDLVRRTQGGPDLPALALARRVEARDPAIRVSYLPMTAKPGETLPLFVEPRIDPVTGRLFAVAYNEVFVEPATGDERGRRIWGAVWPITRATLMSFLYKLHYSLHVPRLWGEERWGLWLMGAVALAWTLDCFVGLYLTFPLKRVGWIGAPAAGGKSWWSRWRPAWRIKTPVRPYRFVFDLHRAAGLWAWLLLLAVAFSAASLNLYREVFYPVLATVSRVTPTPFDLRRPVDSTHPITPAIDAARILAMARRDAAARGWREPLGAIAYDSTYGIYSALFFQGDDDDAAAGATPPTLYYDGGDGHALGARRPWTGTAADIFIQAQFPVHSGRILGLPGRILSSLVGLAVVGLTVTGLVIWWRKRAARVRRHRIEAAGVPAPSVPA